MSTPDPARPTVAHTAVVQDYLKAIWGETEWSDAPVTTSVIATRVGVAASSASEMIRRLAGMGLLHHERYGAVELTAEGRLAALKVVRRHRLLETYLVAELGYTWDEVHDEAEILEHAISDLLVSRMDSKLGHPTRDPHGDPIPTEDGHIHPPPARTLVDLEPGEGGQIVRISDDDPGMLRYFTDHGLELDVPVTLLARRPYGGGLQVNVGGTVVDLGDQAAAAIWIAAG